VKIFYIILLSALYSCISVNSIRENYSLIPIHEQEILINTSNLPLINYEGPKMNKKAAEKLEFKVIIENVKTKLNKLGANIYTNENAKQSHKVEISEFNMTVNFHSITTKVKMNIRRLSDNYTYQVMGTYYKPGMGSETKMFEKAITVALMEFYQMEYKKQIEQKDS